MTKISDMTQVFGIYSYQSPLIRFRAEDHENWKHRELTVKKDFLARTFITKLDEEIWAEKPIFTPNIFSEKETNATPDLDVVPSVWDVSYEWDLEKWNDLGQKIKDSARTHSFCVVQLYNKAPWWKVFTWREIIKIEYDKNDNPIGCKVRWEKRLVGADMWRFHEENLNFYRNEKDNNDGTALLIPFGIPQGDDLGEYDLEQIWDLLIYLRYQLLDINNNSAKSSGFYHYKWGSGTKESTIQTVLDAADVVGSGSGIGASEDALKEIKAIFPGKPEFTVLALETNLKLFAGACRLPLVYFRSEKDVGSGFMGGNVENADEMKVTKKKKYIFAQFAWAVKKLVEMRWGIIVEDVVPFIQAEIDLQELELDIEQEEKENKEKITEDKNNG